MERKGDFKESNWSEEEDDDEDAGHGGNQTIEFQSIGFMIYQKNSHIRFRVLLAPSSRACCEGITLVGASRVVLLDVVWNSSVKWKTISRAYRIGQKKVVYIYRLIMSGTMEGEKCVVQAEKDRLSELVFSSADGKDHGSEIISCAVNDDKILQEMVQHEKISYRFAKILNQPKESNLIDTFG